MDKNTNESTNSNSPEKDIQTKKKKLNYWKLADEDYFPSIEEEEEEDFDDIEDFRLEKETVDDTNSITSRIANLSGWTIADADFFQALLITLLHFVLGAQRKQVLEGMTTDKIRQPTVNGPAWIKPFVEKVPRPQTKDGIYVPPYAARLINYFIKNIRPILHPNQDVVSVWINARGNSLQGGSYNNRIQKVMIKCFGWKDKINKIPNKKITPQIFRRLIPSLIFELDIHPDGMSVRDFIANYAKYVGSSEKIMWSHYIRSLANEKNKEINQTIQVIWTNELAIQLGKNLDAKLGAETSHFQEIIITQQQKDNEIKKLKEEIRDIKREIANNAGEIEYKYKEKVNKLKQQAEKHKLISFAADENSRMLKIQNERLQAILDQINQTHPELINNLQL